MLCRVQAKSEALTPAELSFIDTLKEVRCYLVNGLFKLGIPIHSAHANLTGLSWGVSDGRIWSSSMTSSLRRRRSASSALRP